MNLNGERVPGKHGNEVFEALSSARGRAVLETLRRRSTPLSVEDLAAALAADDETEQSDERRVTIDLTHTTLPKLEDAGLVERGPDGVSAAGHPALDDPAIDRLLETDADRVFEALSKRRRRIALSVLRNRSGAVDRRSLATAVAARERGLRESAISEEAASDVLASLHHTDLPLLEEADLVRIDDDRQVAYDGHPALDTVADAAVAPVVSGD